MDLVERYLQAVGQYLPLESRSDTLAELRENLLAELQDREESAGRPLTEQEIAAALRAHGKPEFVAARYLPQRSLIGPAVYPFYVHSLTRVLPIVIFVSALAGGIQYVGLGHESATHALSSFALGLCSSLLISAAIITGIFAGVEWLRERGKLGKWNEWDPAKLPRVKAHAESAATPKSTAKRALDLVLHCLWMAFVLWVPWHPYWLMGPGVFYLDKLDVSFAPVWHTFYALLIMLLSVQLVLKLLAFVPQAARWIKPLELGTNVLGLAAIGILAAGSVYFVPAGAAADLAKLSAVNHGVGVAVRIAFVFALAGCGKDVWEFAKQWPRKQQFAF